ncbi:4-oxalomesaconate tautomerase [Achromobacter seleniivolatilans]|uniref:4-oxalomesaconate tautomerase n=1 Tax=Achromobacter seleniivolatilans TaxID=3047478 RepID=A0ABY9M0D9_9BURK|nr:4-oxalomesaconate tautomerase [Achromobacter sp. R39]WMD20471.1 4-oxalomesaconate tautomerase [Achromobacter sp. R39]
METVIPCVLMRGGTSRGPFFLGDWLPADPAERDRLLLLAMGSPHALQVDGLGGGNSLTSKVAIVSRPTRPDCDIDYLFAQVSVDRATVDTRPNCGNMLSGAAPFAIDEGLIAAGNGVTSVRVHNVNTGAVIEAVVQTPGGRLTYEGDTRIDGVPGAAAPVRLNFLDAWGAVTGSVFPTGHRQEWVDGIAVTLIDAAMPMVLMRAADFGLTGQETPAQLDGNAGLLERMERIRVVAGARMGLGDVRNSVIPKPVLLAPGSATRHAPPSAAMAMPALSVQSRYFTPRACHRAHAATGAVGVASAFLMPGTVAHDCGGPPLQAGYRTVRIEHPSGVMEIDVDLDAASGVVRAAGLVRTARKIMRGLLYVPGHYAVAGVMPVQAVA